MNLFAISDLHLSFGTNKPMNIFRGWDNHAERIASAWKKIVNNDDTVVLGGDISWALKLDEALADFKFIDSLPGKKIILKGNHDFWWGTVAKIKEFFNKNGIDSISILHNNAYALGDIAVCGTRGWLYDGVGEQDEKVIRRECGRLETSIAQGILSGSKPIIFLHYPPVYGSFICEEIFAIIKKYKIDTVYYGHIHGTGCNHIVNEYDGVKLRLISCDCVNFTPVFISQYI